jgi:hypothetical protein
MVTEQKDGEYTVYRTATAPRPAAAAAAAANATDDDTDKADKAGAPRKLPEVVMAELLPSDVPLVTPAELLELCTWIPLRLTEEERGLLQLLDGALQISEYTDKVDVARNDHGWGQGRGYRGEDAMLGEMKEFCQLVVGLYVAGDLKRASSEVAERASPFEFGDMLRNVFEVGRRYKIQNPTKMRTTYGKLMHILMDAVQPDMAREIRGSVFCPTQSVHSLLRPFGAEAAEALLRDPDLLVAVSPIDRARGDFSGSMTFADSAARDMYVQRACVRVRACVCVFCCVLLV